RPGMIGGGGRAFRRACLGRDLVRGRAAALERLDRGRYLPPQLGVLFAKRWLWRPGAGSAPDGHLPATADAGSRAATALGRSANIRPRLFIHPAISLASSPAPQNTSPRTAPRMAVPVSWATISRRRETSRSPAGVGAAASSHRGVP